MVQVMAVQFRRPQGNSLLLNVTVPAHRTFGYSLSTRQYDYAVMSASPVKADLCNMRNQGDQSQRDEWGRND